MRRSLLPRVSLQVRNVSRNVHMTASEAFVETLSKRNVTHSFGIVGSAFMDPLHSFDTAGIRFISVQHEQNAAHMADGYARASGKHGVCIAQNGPGVTNFINGIATAYWARSPVVAITPQCASGAVGLGGFQEINQLPVFSDITTYQGHVHHPSRIADVTDYAFYRALSDRGPVQVNIPRDYFSYEGDYDLPSPHIPSAVPVTTATIQNIVGMLNTSNRPVILAGGGVVSSGSVKLLEKYANLKNIPVATTYLHNDAFPCTSPLYLGPIGYNGCRSAMDTIENSDFILAIGTRLGPFGTLPQYGKDYWPKNAFVVQVDSDANVLGMSKKANMIVHADAKNFVEKLLLNRCNPLSLESISYEPEDSECTGIDGIHPRAALAKLSECLPYNVMVSTDVGNCCSLANNYLHFSEGNFFAPLSYGSCGTALPTIMGAKVACPDRPAVAYVGDGAWGMSMAETMTCLRENIPVTVVVFKNYQWGAEKKNQILWFNNKYVGSNLKNPSFSDIAKSMGAEGITINRRSEIKSAMATALRNQAGGLTTVIEIELSRWLGEPFRRDAMKPPRRYLEKYECDDVLHENELDQCSDMKKRQKLIVHWPPKFPTGGEYIEREHIERE